MSGPIRLLVVDDSVVVRSLLTRLIEQEDDLTLASTAVDGRQAVEKVRAMDFDVVILDQTMPGMTGLEVATEILRACPGMPVFLYTGYSESVTPEIAERAGIRALLPKPLDVDALYNALRRELPQDA